MDIKINGAVVTLKPGLTVIATNCSAIVRNRAYEDIQEVSDDILISLMPEAMAPVSSHHKRYEEIEASLVDNNITYGVVLTGSPLMVGYARKENVYILNEGGVTRPEAETYGLSADQILHGVFGMQSTRNPAFQRKLNDVREKATAGDIDAAMQMSRLLAYGG